jgi:beta-ureidopropionase / N-carbamoyl-L-amino-acid hydrolase
MVDSLVSQLSINSDRLVQSIEDLAQIGALPGGGVRRIAYSATDMQARHQIQQWMQAAGMSVKIDPAGNIISRYPGKYPNAAALATGSHIDTVPNGGRYDGAFGVLAGLEVVRVLHERQILLNRPLEVIVFTDEEGTMIGSKAMSGRAILDPATYARVDGIDIQTCLTRVGGDWERLTEARRTAADIAAFVELHVEQGPVLECLGKQIGVVEGIVGQRRYIITVKGSSSHAGSTPMQMRQDALVAASKVVLAVNKIAHTPGGQQVATVGWMEVLPNAANVIPGIVKMSLDIRDLSNQHLDNLMAQLQAEIETIAVETQTYIDIQPRLRNEPALAKTHIQQAIAQVCEDLRLSYTHLPSRASHDAQELATFTDMGMIFVPSQAGVSHAEIEYTSPQQCAEGTNVLLHTFLELDRHYRCE